MKRGGGEEYVSKAFIQNFAQEILAKFPRWPGHNQVPYRSPRFGRLVRTEAAKMSNRKIFCPIYPCSGIYCTISQQVDPSVFHIPAVRYQRYQVKFGSHPNKHVQNRVRATQLCKARDSLA